MEAFSGYNLSVIEHSPPGFEDEGIGGKVVCAGAVAAVGVGKADEPGVGC
jgi:hypothetical protein